MHCSSFLRYKELLNKGTLKHAKTPCCFCWTTRNNVSVPSKVLAQNSGYDPQETLVKVQAEHGESGQLTGVDLNTGKDFSKITG